jgi:hypothetical protein
LRFWNHFTAGATVKPTTPGWGQQHVAINCEIPSVHGNDLTLAHKVCIPACTLYFALIHIEKFPKIMAFAHKASPCNIQSSAPSQAVEPESLHPAWF